MGKHTQPHNTVVATTAAVSVNTSQYSLFIQVLAAVILALAVQVAVLQNQIWSLQQGYESKSCIDNNALLDQDSVRLTMGILGKEKVSELLMSRKVQKLLKVNTTKWTETPLVLEPALTLLSLPMHGTTKEEITNALVDRVNVQGVVSIRSLVSPDLCRRSAHRAHILTLRAESGFGHVMGRLFRKDIPLPFEKPHIDILFDVLNVVGPALEKLVGPESVLVDFASMITYPGAKEQMIHSDSVMTKPEHIMEWGKLVTVFVYLDDVDPNMGAFDVWPGTHTHYQFLPMAERNGLRNVPGIRMALPQGSIVMYDSRVEHRGFANTSNFTRPSFYFSFLESNKTAPSGPTYTIHQNYRDLFTLKDLMVSSPVYAQVPPSGIMSRLNQCKIALDSACPLWKSAREACLQCASVVEDELDDRVAVCQVDHMEKLCGIGIFATNFQFRTSWGQL